MEQPGMKQASSEMQKYYSGDGATVSKIEDQMSVMSQLFSTWKRTNQPQLKHTKMYALHSHLYYSLYNSIVINTM